MPYWSRYPVPLTLKELRQADVVPPSFCDDFKRLHNSLCKKLYNQVKNGWDSEAGARHVQMRSTRYGDEVRLKSRIR
jgi:hypothetical protein